MNEHPYGVHMDELTNIYCQKCKLGICNDDADLDHRERSGYLYCSICDSLYHSKYPDCGHVKLKLKIVESENNGI